MTKDEIILTLLAKNNGPIVGTTRLQKLLFLIEKEGHIEPENTSFGFEPYRFGPASKSLYDDLEFLVNMGYMEKTGSPNIEPKLHGLNEIEDLDGEEFLSSGDDENDDAGNSDEEKEIEIKTAGNDLIVYKITQKGIDQLTKKGLLESSESKIIDSMRKKYGNKSLIELLRYVYTRYPDYTTESEIRKQVNG